MERVETAKLRSDLDVAGHEDFAVYSGDDLMLMPHLGGGVVGVVSVCSHLIGSQLKQIISAFNDGKNEEAMRIYLEYLPLMSTIMTLTTSPIPVKAAAAMIGLDVGEPRCRWCPRRTTRQWSFASRSRVRAWYGLRPGKELGFIEPDHLPRGHRGYRP